MKKHIKTFVDEYKVFLELENKKDINYKRDIKTIINSLLLFVLMISIFLVLGKLFGLHTNITYLFLIANTALLCSFLLYNYRLLLNINEKINIITILTVQTVKILFVQILMYLLLSYFIFEAVQSSLTLIIALIIGSILLIILSSIDLTFGLENSRIVFYSILQALAGLYVFIIIIVVIKIENPMIMFIIGYTGIYLYEFVSVFLSKKFLSYFAFPLAFILFYGGVFIFLGEEKSTDPFGEIQYNFLLKENTSELFVPIVNYINSTEDDYTYQDIHYWRIREDILLEYEDYYYTIMSNADIYYSFDESLSINPHTLLRIYDKDYQNVSEIRFDNKTGMLSFIDDELYLLLESDNNESFELHLNYNFYKINGTNLEMESVGGLEEVQGIHQNGFASFTLIDEELYITSKNIYFNLGLIKRSNELDYLKCYDIRDSNITVQSGYEFYGATEEGRCITLSRVIDQDDYWVNGILSNDIVLELLKVKRVRYKERFWDEDEYRFEYKYAYMQLNDYINEDIEKQIDLDYAFSERITTILFKDDILYVVHGKEIISFNTEGKIIDIASIHSSIYAYSGLHIIALTDKIVAVKVDRDVEDEIIRIHQEIMIIDLENLSSNTFYTRNAELTTIEWYLFGFFLLIKRRSSFSL